MRIQLTDPVEIFKAYIEKKRVYNAPQYFYSYNMSGINFKDISDNNLQFWIEESDLKDIREETQKEQSWQEEYYNN